jgi:hypothetical protein
MVEYKRKNYLANRERYNASGCEWQKKNKDKVNADHRRWRAENREKVREYNRRWYANGNGKGPAKSAGRRKAVRRATPPWAEKEAIEMMYRMSMERGLVVDHIVPLTHARVCGLHVWANLQLLTDNANRVKGNDFMVGV